MSQVVSIITKIARWILSPNNQENLTEWYWYEMLNNMYLEKEHIPLLMTGYWRSYSDQTAIMDIIYLCCNYLKLKMIIAMLKNGNVPVQGFIISLFVIIKSIYIGEYI